MNNVLTENYRGVILIILDGWGISPTNEGNAIAQAKTPNFNSYIANYPHCSISASGEEAGLAWGEVGNSEVGHFNIGSGRVVWQSLARINNAIIDNSFFRNSVLIKTCREAKKNHKNLHLVGLVSEGGVHSHIDHLLALMTLVGHNGAPNTFIHIFTDGRDSPPKIALTDIKRVEDKIKACRVGKIASICGRYYALDRDKRWTRTEVAYEAIAKGTGEYAPTPYDAVKQAYQKNLTDEFIPPTVITDKNHEPIATIKDGDYVIFFNFREDRIIQLVKAFWDPNFREFPTVKYPDLHLTSFSKYFRDFDFPVSFPPILLSRTLPEEIARAGMKQIHIAETEKYAHVTYFLNGGKEEPMPNEDRVLVPSPKIATYDKKPEMSVFSVAEKIQEAVQKQSYQLIVANFANPDMVGHTGNLQATIKAVESCDQALKTVVDTALKFSYITLITADHGNAEEKYNPETGQISKDHTSSPVPVILITPGNQKNGDSSEVDKFLNSQPVGVLADIAPTVLKLLNIPQPKEMTGFSLTNILQI